jgi:hypothetical protein
METILVRYILLMSTITTTKHALHVTTIREKFVVIFGLLLISDTIKSCFVGVL